MGDELFTFNGVDARTGQFLLPAMSVAYATDPEPMNESSRQR